jgi:hypothetical protein
MKTNDSAAEDLDETSTGSSNPDEIVTRIKARVQFMHLAWGVAWLVGFMLIFLHNGPNNKEIVAMPPWVPLTVLFVLLLGAGVFTAVLGVQVFGTGTVDSASRRRGVYYGLAWLIGFVALILTTSMVTKGLTSTQAGLIWGATATGLTAVLHLAGSAIWLDRGQLRLGIWIIVINFIAAASGSVWQPLILAIGGGAVMVVLGLIGRSRGHVGVARAAA